MTRLLILALLAFSHSTFGKEIPPFLSDWVPTTKQLTEEEWYAANNDGTTWDVYLEGEHVKVKPFDFAKQEEPISLKLQDGTLISDEQGEFGAAVFWESKKGRTKLSEDHIRQFIQLGTRVFAISGLAHLGTDYGDFLELKRKGNGWRISRIAKLKDEPQKAVRESQTSLLVLTYSSLTRVSLDGSTKLIVQKGDWDGLIPRTLVMDGKGFAYVGFSQRVAKVELSTGKVVYLVPYAEIFENDLKRHKEKRLERILDSTQPPYRPTDDSK